MEKDKIRASFDKHRANPHVSTDEYVRARQIALGESVVARERVYLDKRYWIILRDVAIGRNTEEGPAVLLRALQDSVRSKHRICPISETVFLELLKQSDLRTRRETAMLIDQLSEGVTLLPHPQRVATEIAHFLHSHGQQELYPLHSLVWSRLSYALGVQHPTNTMFSENEQRVVQKAFFDQMWDCSLTEMVDLLGNAAPPIFDYEALAQKLNGGSALHAQAIRSFPQTYKAEIRGSLKVFMQVAREILENITKPAPNADIAAPENEQTTPESQLLSFFCREIAKKEVAVALRTLHIGALCHAAVRWDKKRKLTGNDLYDFHHAEAAVGYCDVFLTERPLKTLLQQSHMQLTQDFPCRAISSLEEATTWATA